MQVRLSCENSNKLCDAKARDPNQTKELIPIPASTRVRAFSWMPSVSKNRRHKFYKSMNTPPQNKKEPRIENSHGKCTQQTKATLFPTTLWVGRGSHHHPKWTFNHLAVPSKHSACAQSDAQVKVEARRPIRRIAGCGYSPEVGTLSSNVHALSRTFHITS